MMEVKVRGLGERYTEIIVSDGNAHIESGVLDYEEALRVAGEFARAADELREYATNYLVWQHKTKAK
jgi:hypothetical protein